VLWRAAYATHDVHRDAARPEAQRADRRAALPDRTRRATLLERNTAERLSWDIVVRLNRYLELAGKLATAVWLAFVAVVLGVDWKEVVEGALNSDKPVKGAVALAIIVPTCCSWPAVR
jgi:hypothetical protein